MNQLIIRICEIALSSLTELQMQNRQHLQNELKDIHERNCATASSINIEHMEFDRKDKMLEQRKLEVKQLMDIAYISDFIKRKV